MKVFATAIAALFLNQNLVWGSLRKESSAYEIEARAAATCGGPNTAITYLQGYSPVSTCHSFGIRSVFVGDAADSSDWVIQGELFRTWETQQDGTVPFYSLYNPTNTDYMYLLSNNSGALPSAPGYTVHSAVIFVYATPVCGSVPLYAMYKSAAADRYYSTDAADPGRMTQYGYVSQETVAYVLPLDCGCS